MRRLLLVVVLFALSGCTTVRPWERGAFAQRAMTAGLGDRGIVGRYESKLVETKTGHGAAVGAPGGGCGCSQ